MDKIAILIPCYNEAKTIGKVINDWKKSIPEAVIYVYDNNSKDETAAIARDAGAVVRHEYSQGKGNVIRRMFREIDAECYIMLMATTRIRLNTEDRWRIWSWKKERIWWWETASPPHILRKTSAPSTISATVLCAPASTGFSVPTSGTS